MPKPTMPGCPNTWEVREDPAKNLKQVVLKVREVREGSLGMEPRFLEAYLDRISTSGPTWAWEPRLLDKPERFGYFVRAGDLAVELSCLNLRFSYSVYLYPEGALFQMILRADLEGKKRLQIRYPVDPATADASIRGALEKVFSEPVVPLTILDTELMPVMTRDIRQGAEAAAAALRYWNLARNRSITEDHSFEKALERYRRESK
ncbi:MAG: hypothetical protein HYZ53_00470 [Planctomycetes bacterium]|nr:hypothetical protein [Planctomycetota bacterium]